jgi:hypothetical protein
VRWLGAAQVLMQLSPLKNRSKLPRVLKAATTAVIGQIDIVPYRLFLVKTFWSRCTAVPHRSQHNFDFKKNPPLWVKYVLIPSLAIWNSVEVDNRPYSLLRGKSSVETKTR